ncbi:hypothetical protein GALMADRAFT_483801 [Galerina marginata CBS 339.88]|uniref:BTB domain-containing protein n=1 Tax=Galerina marginata (strain CBS 339.88) TaxID=685588 RepID=A0A067SX42_GALM3|nr:hypothetical protein GALMADRAFT_483801 [Galerina marginata CBS 339.88]
MSSHSDTPTVQSDLVLSRPSSPMPVSDTGALPPPTVEDKLFQVLKNGFDVPGTIFEAMFSLPSRETRSSLLEGNSLENPIYLPGIQKDHFRVFLRALFPFTSISPIVSYEDWVGVLHLATMWEFNEIRTKAITALSSLLIQQDVLEKISLGRRYRVSAWIQDGYVQLVQKKPLVLEELRMPPSVALDWETIARICHIRENFIITTFGGAWCDQCGTSQGNTICRCYCLPKIEKMFQIELGAMKEMDNNSSPPLPSESQTEIRQEGARRARRPGGRGGSRY